MVVQSSSTTVRESKQKGTWLPVNRRDFVFRSVPCQSIEQIMFQLQSEVLASCRESVCRRGDLRGARRQLPVPEQEQPSSKSVSSVQGQSCCSGRRLGTCLCLLCSSSTQGQLAAWCSVPLTLLHHSFGAAGWMEGWIWACVSAWTSFRLKLLYREQEFARP